MRYLEINKGIKPSLTRDIRSAINIVTGDDGAYKSAWNDPIKNGRKVKVEISLNFVKQVNKKNSNVSTKLEAELKKMGHDVRSILYMGAGFRSLPAVIFKINLPVTENASAGATSSGAIATAPAGGNNQGVPYGGDSTYGVGDTPKKKKKKAKKESIETTILKR